MHGRQGFANPAGRSIQSLGPMKLSRLLLHASLAATAAGSTCVAAGETQHDPISLTAIVQSVPKPVGCGILFVGTPVEFRVLKANEPVPAKRISAVVPCLDFFPGYFVVEKSYRLRLSVENIHRIEIPNQLAKTSISYLVDAQRLDDGKRLTWPAH
jgi:hypothetical protein